MRRSTGEKLYEIQIAVHDIFWFFCAHFLSNGVGMKKHCQWFFHNRICCHSVFSSEVLYVSVNCKVHFPEDIISWQPAKTVWQNMQMRALGVVLKNGIGFYGRCMADVWESRLFFQCFFSQFFTMQPIFFMIFLLYYCTDVKTVKCTIQRTSSAGSLRKPSDKSCRCAPLSAPWVEADFITQGITHWVKTITTTS